MSLQLLRRAAAGLAVALAMANQAAAWQVGNWNGVPIIGNNGGFLGCRMNVRYNSGITLHFIQLRSYSLFIGMSKPEWAMNPNAIYAMGLVIDGRYVRRAPGEVLAGLNNAVFLNLGTDRLTRELLARRFSLTLVNNQQNYNFALTSTAAALQRLEYCVQTGT